MLFHPLTTSTASSPLITPPNTPAPAKSDTHNSFSLLSEEDDVDKEVSQIARQIGQNETDLRNTLERLGIKHKDKFTRKALDVKNWTIDTFIKHNLPFLYAQKIVDPNTSTYS